MLYVRVGDVVDTVFLCFLDLKINNTALPMATHTKVLGFTLDAQVWRQRGVNTYVVELPLFALLQ